MRPLGIFRTISFCTENFNVNVPAVVPFQVYFDYLYKKHSDTEKVDTVLNYHPR